MAFWDLWGPKEPFVFKMGISTSKFKKILAACVVRDSSVENEAYLDSTCCRGSEGPMPVYCEI
jgi:hypothetical protein